MTHKTGDDTVSQLHAHVFGPDGPTSTLINEGRFPDGWARKYLELLASAQREWQDQPLWPRELVAAIHFTSWYLNLRYDVWRSRSSIHNKDTERELASLRSPSEIFLMYGSVHTGEDGVYTE